LKEHPDVMAHIDKAVRQALGLAKAAEGEVAVAAAAQVEAPPPRPVAASKR
jgi:hypothetical protein